MSPFVKTDVTQFYDDPHDIRVTNRVTSGSDNPARFRVRVAGPLPKSALRANPTTGSGAAPRPRTWSQELATLPFYALDVAY
jgi:hypothetical protein